MGTKITISTDEAEWARVPVGSLSDGQLYETETGTIYIAHPYGLTRLDGLWTFDVSESVRVRKVRPGTTITLEAE